jgi:hypothetical protein
MKKVSNIHFAAILILFLACSSSQLKKNRDDYSYNYVFVTSKTLNETEKKSLKEIVKSRFFSFYGWGEKSFSISTKSDTIYIQTIDSIPKLDFELLFAEKSQSTLRELMPQEMITGNISSQFSSTTINEIVRQIINSNKSKLLNQMDSDCGVIGIASKHDTSSIEIAKPYIDSVLSPIGYELIWCLADKSKTTTDSCFLVCAKKTGSLVEPAIEVHAPSIEADHIKMQLTEINQLSLLEKTRNLSSINRTCFLLDVNGIGYCILQFDSPILSNSISIFPYSTLHKQIIYRALSLSPLNTPIKLVQYSKK